MHLFTINLLKPLFKVCGAAVIIPTPVVAPAIIAVIALVSITAVATVIIAATSISRVTLVAATKILVTAPTCAATGWVIVLHKILVTVLNVGRIAKLQLAIGYFIQLTPNGIVMHKLFMPVAVGQLHIIGDGMGKTRFLLGIILMQGFVNYQLQVFAQVGVPWVPFRVAHGVWFSLVRFPLWYWVRAVNIQLKIAYKKQVVPKHMPEIFHVFKVWV